MALKRSRKFEKWHALFLCRFWSKWNDDDLSWTGAKKVFKVSANWWALILDALHNNLMYQQALAVFFDEYAKEQDRPQAASANNRGVLEKALAAVKPDPGKLFDAILADVAADQFKNPINAPTN